MKYVIDASTLINFYKASILCEIFEIDEEYLIGEIVLHECGEIISCHLAAKNDRWQKIDQTQISGSQFFELNVSRRLGICESECISYCLTSPKSALVSDDKKARKVGVELLGDERITGTIGLLQKLVLTGRLSAIEAQMAYMKMKDSGSFLPKLDDEHF